MRVTKRCKLLQGIGQGTRKNHKADDIDAGGQQTSTRILSYFTTKHNASEIIKPINSMIQNLFGVQPKHQTKIDAMKRKESYTLRSSAIIVEYIGWIGLLAPTTTNYLEAGRKHRQAIDKHHAYGTNSLVKFELQ